MAALDETSTWITPVTGLTNGDPLSATNLTTPETQLTKRTKYLRDHSPWARDASLIMLPLYQAAAPGQGFSPVIYGWRQDTVLGATLMLELLNVEPVTITGVSAYLYSGGHTLLPATMPVVSLIEIDALGTATTIASAADPASSVAIYEGKHVVAVLLSKTMVGGRRYVIRLDGEAGANAVASNTICYGMAVAWTAPASV